MSDPTPYSRTYSFTDYQAGNPSAPLPGIQVDNELENVEQSLGEAIDAIKDVRRSDGKLKNGIVTVDSLDPTVAAGVGAGALASAQAAAASADAASDSAVAAAASATAASGSATAASGYASNALTSRNEASGFADDSAAAASLSQTARDYASKWATAAEGVDVDDGVNPVGKSSYHWAQVALDAAAGSIADGAVTTAKLADGALSADTTGRAKMADGFVTSAKIADGTIVRAKLATAVTDELDGKAGLGIVNTFTKTQVWSKGADVASAAALTLGDDGNYFDITGTTTITSVASKGVGAIVKLHFDSSLTLTHHATDLVLPGGANRIVSAGDEVELIEYATGDWRLTKHTRNVIPGWEPIASFSFNNTPSADIIDLSGFQSLRLTGHFLPVNDGVKLLLRTSTNNGTSYQDGASSYSQQFDRGSLSITNAGDGTASGVELTLGSSAGQVTTEGVQINIIVNNLNVAARQTWVNGTIHLANAAGNPIAGVVGGRRIVAEANNAIRLLFETGNISTGNLFVEGLRG